MNKDLKLIPIQGMYKVSHECITNTGYELGFTIVRAKSKQEAMDKLNGYLSDRYNSYPCESIDMVIELEVLE
jgi:hypothetical protein